MSSRTEIDRRLAAVCGVARAAGALAMRHFNNLANLKVETKGPQNHVSIADREVEELIVRELSKAFPGDVFFGEEGGGKAGERIWIIDPIDGTTNFVRGLPDWGVSIGFVRGNEAEIGCIYLPTTDALYAAKRGGGATCNGRPIRVSRTKDIANGMMGLGFSYRRKVAPFAALTERLLSAHCEFRRVGSCVHGMAYAADGRTDGYYEQHINSWDIMAGLVLVREAGGWTSDYLTGDWLTKGNPILACTPGLRGELLKLTGMEEKSTAAPAVSRKRPSRSGRSR
jgi:myo-inositol-1(or 4)-monophosphatase